MKVAQNVCFAGIHKYYVKIVPLKLTFVMSMFQHSCITELSSKLRNPVVWKESGKE